MNAKRKQLVLAAAVAAVSLFAGAAQAQFRQDNSGRANDASNRVGSNGYNDSTGNRSGVSNVTPNQIVYGNVTGGREFRGPVGETDPQAFRGPVAGQRTSDVFIRNSSSAPLPYQPGVDLSVPQPFYGQSRGVAPPIGTVREGFTGAYLGTDLTPGLQGILGNEFNSALISQYTQPLGTSPILGGTRFITTDRVGDVREAGPLSINNSVLTGSPLYGVRQWNAGDRLSDMDAISGNGSSLLGGPDRLRGDNLAVQRMRAELQGLVAGQQQQNQNQNNLNNDTNQTPDQQNGLQQNLARPLESPENQRVDRSTGGAINADPLGSSVNTSQGTRQRMTLATAAQQSTQYDELRKRLERYQTPQEAALDQAHQFQLDRRRAAAVPSRGGGSTTQRAAAGGGGDENAPPPEPMKITSVATGVKAPALRTQLQSAEDLMREGKFQSAIDKLNIAGRAAPNQPLIWIARANAELGGGFFGQAYRDLRGTYIADPTVLAAQFDLAAVMKPERINFIVGQLEELSKTDSRAETAPFLLGYIMYNTGKEAEAARYLDEADKRASAASGRPDPVIQKLRRFWRLKPAAAPQSEQQPKSEQQPDVNK